MQYIGASTMCLMPLESRAAQQQCLTWAPAHTPTAPADHGVASYGSHCVETDLVQSKEEQKALNLTSVWQPKYDCVYMADIKKLVVDSKVG